MALFQAMSIPLSLVTASPLVPIRNISDEARSPPTSSSTRSLKAPAKPCSAQNMTSPGRVDFDAVSPRTNASARPMAAAMDAA